MTEKYCKPHPINPWNAYDFPYNFYKFLLLTTPRKKYKRFSLFYYLKILWNDRDRIYMGFYSEPRFHALAIFCEILNRKISIKATHPQRLSYKLKNTLSSRITWWHLAAILDLPMMRCELQRWFFSCFSINPFTNFYFWQLRGKNTNVFLSFTL